MFFFVLGLVLFLSGRACFLSGGVVGLAVVYGCGNLNMMLVP